eukprot:m.55751 g.55751  ORF g.55751 m.55751 type:complete len:1311 (-) comp11515_c0_seq1:1912-5844(-)
MPRRSSRRNKSVEAPPTSVESVATNVSPQDQMSDQEDGPVQSRRRSTRIRSKPTSSDVSQASPATPKSPARRSNKGSKRSSMVAHSSPGKTLTAKPTSADNGTDSDSDEEVVAKRPSRRAKSAAASRLAAMNTPPSRRQSQAKDQDSEDDESSDAIDSIDEEEVEDDIEEDVTPTPSARSQRAKLAANKRATPTSQRKPARRTTVTPASASKTRRGPSKANPTTSLANQTQLLKALGTKSVATKKWQEWADKYDETDQTEALCELLSTIMRLCGNEGVVTAEMLSDVSDSLDELSEHFPESTELYPLVASKAFADKIETFVDNMTAMTKGDILYDGFFGPALVAWLTEMSSSQIRALRHTSTVIAMVFGTSIVGIIEELDAEVEQLESSRAKKDKLRVDEIQERKATLSEFITELLEGIVIHRYRDTVSEIRRCVLSELGNWILRFSEELLDDKYLKYFGWCLNDKDAAVRSEALLFLTQLFDNKDFAVHLDLFYTKFRNRILYMAADVSSDVVVDALKLHEKLFDCERLEDAQTQWLWELVFSNDAAVSQQAGHFFVHTLMEEQLPHLFEEESIDDEELQRRIFLHTITRYSTRVAIEQGVEKYTTLVAALASNTPTINDWETYLALMKQDNDAKVPEMLEEDEEEEPQALDDTRLSPVEEEALLNIFIAAVKHFTGEAEVFGEQVKVSQKERKQTRAQLGKVFLKELLALMDKFAQDAPKVCALAQLLQILDPSQQNARGSWGTQTIDVLKGMLQRHTDEATLLECVRALHAFSESSLSYATHANDAVSALLDELKAELEEIVAHGFPAQDDDEMSDEAYKLFGCLRRLEKIGSCYSLSSLELEEPCLRVLETSNEQIVAAPILEEAVKLFTILIGYQTHAMLAEEVPDLELAAEQSARRKRFSGALCFLFQSGTKRVKNAAFTASTHMCLLTCSSEQVSEQFGPFPPAELCEGMMNFVCDLLETPAPATPNPDATPEETFALQYNATLRKDAVANFCSLVEHNLIDAVYLEPLLKFYLQRDATDPIKHALSAQRKHNMSNYAQLLHNSMHQWFEEEQQIVDDMKQVASRLVKTYGVTSDAKTRKSVIELTRLGVIYAFEQFAEDPNTVPQQLAFLEIVKEWAMKLAVQDRVTMLKYIENDVIERLGITVDESSDAWLPYHLLENALAGHRGTGSRSTTRTPASRKQSAKRGSRRTSSSKKSSTPKSRQSNRRNQQSSQKIPDSPSTGYWGNLSNSLLVDEDSADEDVEDISDMESTQGTPKKAKQTRRAKQVLQELVEAAEPSPAPMRRSRRAALSMDVDAIDELSD